MQTDVKSVHTGGTQTNQALISGRVRIKGVAITGGAGAGTGKFLDASGGTVLLEFVAVWYYLPEWTHRCGFHSLHRIYLNLLKEQPNRIVCFDYMR